MTASYADLRQRIIDGDDTITPAQLDSARRQAEFDQVQVEATEAARARTAEEQRQAEVARVRAEYDQARSESVEHLKASRRAALDALSALRHGMAEHNRRAHRIQREITKYGIDDLEVLSQFNIDMELDRLEREGRRDGLPTPPYSRLHDDQARGLI